MRTIEHSNTELVNYLVSKDQTSHFIRCIFEQERGKTLSVVFPNNSKSSTFPKGESGLTDRIQIVSHPLFMDEDAIKLQSALLKKPAIDGNAKADTVILFIAGCLCLYVLASLVTRGSV